MRLAIGFIFFLSVLVLSQNRWTKLNGPEGAAIAGLYAKGDTLLAGTGFSRGLIFYSTNRGEQWHQANINVFSRVRDFVETADSGFIAANYPKALYKSFDLKTWTKLQPNGMFWSLGKDQDNYLFAGREFGVMNISVNNGLTWTVTEPASSRIENFATSENYLFCSTGNLIMRKSRGSFTWAYTTVTTPGGLQVFTADSNKIYAYTTHEVFLSTDEGDSWIEQNTGLNYESMDKCIYNNRLIGAFRDETGWSGVGWGAAVSDDQGITWEWSQAGLPPKISSTDIVKSGRDTFLGTNAAGVFRSTDYGESWFPVNKGLTAARVRDIHIDNEGILYTAAWSNGLSKSTDLGESWTVINNGVTNVNFYSIISDSNGRLLTGSDRGIFRSTNKGENWIRITGPGNDFVYHLWKDKFNRIYALTYGSGLYRSIDLGESWIRLDNNFNSTFIFGVAMDDSGNLYAGGRGSGAIYKSADDGNSWTNVYQGIPNAIISQIVISPNDHIFATSINEGILRSTDQGQTWELKSNGLPSLKVQPLIFDRDGTLYVGFNTGGIYLSKDEGESWQNASGNFGSAVVYKFLLHEKDLFLATDESVWKSNPDSLTSVTEDDIKPKEYFLSQNYPNPFNPTTTIKYSLPEEGRITIIIYDILGREVSRLIDEEKPAGEYSVNWTAISYPTGIYICRMRSGKFSETRKLVLLK